jgi:homoserine kinase
VTVLGVRVPASTSNLGAGFDCLGLALDLWLEARLEPGEGPPSYSGTLAGLDADSDLTCAMLRGLDALDGHRLSVHSDIPIGKGLGSSAAAIVAGLALARLALGDPFDRDAIFRGAAQEEGHPDNAGPAVYGGLVLAAHRPTTLTLHRDLGIALAVPEHAMSTKTARDLLPATVARETAVAQAARSAALVLGLTWGDPDLIDFGMDDRLAVPHRRNLIKGYDAAVRAALDAGAYGVTISGAGSALVAIAAQEDVGLVAASLAEALRIAGTPADPLRAHVAREGLTVMATG